MVVMILTPYYIEVALWLYKNCMVAPKGCKTGLNILKVCKTYQTKIKKARFG